MHSHRAALQDLLRLEQVDSAMWARRETKTECAPTGGQVSPFIFYITAEPPNTCTNTDSEQTTAQAHREQEAWLKPLKPA